MKKQRTLAFLSSQDAKYDRLKSTRASARDAKLSTYNRAHTNDEDGAIALFSFRFIEEEGALLLGKQSKSTRTNSLKPTSLEAGSEIICDLCAVVSFIVLCLICYFTTN